MKNLLLPLFLVLLLITPAGAVGENLVVISAGPSWPGFTNKDGSGLYHDIIQAIYAADYAVKHVYTSSDQANALIAAGRADIKLGETRVEAPLLLGRYPIYENAYYALYRKDRIRAWRGPDSLREKQIAWREGYYSQTDFPVEITPRSVRRGESALMMILGRVDFYVDDLALIKQSFEATSEVFDREHYGLQKIGSRKYYPVFLDSNRGRLLKNLFETGIEQLYRNGQLEQIYQRWEYPLPELAIPQQGH